MKSKVDKAVFMSLGWWKEGRIILMIYQNSESAEKVQIQKTTTLKKANKKYRCRQMVR